MAFQPALNDWMRMRSVVIDDEMQLHRAGILIIEMSEELEELLMTMTTVTLPDDGPFGNVERSEKRCGPMAPIIVCHRTASAALYRQSRLRTIQRLNLALFVDAEHDRLVRRIQIQAYYVGQLFAKAWVCRELKRLDAVRLESVRIPYRRTDAGLIPNALAIDRQLQCVAPAGLR